MSNEANVEINDNRIKIKDVMESKKSLILESWGFTAESFAKGYTPVVTGNLRNSISHKADLNDDSVSIGTNVDYAKYVELGYCGKHDETHHMLQKALENHENTYRNIAKIILKA